MKSRRRPYLTPLTSPSQPPSISTSPPQVAIVSFNSYYTFFF
ncbi:BnaC03g76180D [Brassica napus]|uniref:BnaC03g76180D protein n=1 Tax=Brassica napus TaxID=3708 RepID=A0A078ILQ2_BRANA|nr:BnaC03g76180D [Brassica napus]